MGVISRFKWLFGLGKQPKHILTDEDGQTGIMNRRHNTRIKELEIQIKETELKRQLDEAREDRLTSTNPAGFEEKVIDIVQNYLEDYEDSEEVPNDLTSFLKLLPNFMGKNAQSTGSEAQLSQDPVIAAQQLNQQNPSSPVPPSPPPAQQVDPGTLQLLKEAIDPEILEELVKADEKTFLAYSSALWKDLNKSKA